METLGPDTTKVLKACTTAIEMDIRCKHAPGNSEIELILRFLTLVRVLRMDGVAAEGGTDGAGPFLPAIVFFILIRRTNQLRILDQLFKSHLESY